MEAPLHLLLLVSLCLLLSPLPTQAGLWSPSPAPAPEEAPVPAARSLTDKAKDALNEYLASRDPPAPAPAPASPASTKSKSRSNKAKYKKPGKSSVKKESKKLKNSSKPGGWT